MRDIVERICKIEAEIKKRRENDFLAAYNTGEKIHTKQLAFHKCKKRNRWVFGGNRSGKTECGAVECVYMARGIHPYRQNRKDVCGWVVSLSTQVQRDVAFLDGKAVLEVGVRGEAFSFAFEIGRCAILHGLSAEIEG